MQNADIITVIIVIGFNLPDSLTIQNDVDTISQYL